MLSSYVGECFKGLFFFFNTIIHGLQISEMVRERFVVLSYLLHFGSFVCIVTIVCTVIEGGRINVAWVPNTIM